MKALKVFARVLLVIPLGLLLYHLVFASSDYTSNSMQEFFFMVIGVPIAIFNLWLWLEPEGIREFLKL